MPGARNCSGFGGAAPGEDGAWLVGAGAIGRMSQLAGEDVIEASGLTPDSLLEGTGGGVDAGEIELTWLSLDERACLISGRIMRLLLADAACMGVPQILQKRALSASSLLHFGQRSIA